MSVEANYYFSDTESFVYPEVFKGIRYPWEALKNADLVIERVLTKPGVESMLGECKGPVHTYGCYSVGRGTVIYNDVTIIGPVIIGEDCEIMPGAVIRPGTIIGHHCVIGHGCEIKHSVVQNYAKVQSMSFVGDCVIGRSARVGSGVITANRKFNQSNVTARSEEGRLDMGTSFFGCVLGDHSRIGANGVTQPGTLVGPYTWIYPGTVVRGFIPRQKRVYFDRPIVLEENPMIELKP